MKFTYQNIEYNIDDELSFKNFTHWEFMSRPQYNFNGKVIYSSCFCHEIPDSIIFGSLVGATFIKCDLRNVIVPVGNTLIDCKTDRFQVQNDLNDWIIDRTNKPVDIIDYALFGKLGLSKPRPQDIPNQKVTTRIDWLAAARGI